MHIGKTKQKFKCSSVFLDNWSSQEKENEEKYSGQHIAPSDYDEEDSSDEVATDEMEYSSMTNRELKDLLDDLKVKYKPVATKSVLIGLLEKADKGELEIAS